MIDDNTLNAAWYIDNETGREVLVDLKTKKIIARKVDGNIVEPSE